MLPKAPRRMPLPLPPFLLCRLTPHHYPQSKPTYTMATTTGMHTALQWHVIHANGNTAQRSWLVVERASPNKTLTRLQMAGWALGCRDVVGSRSGVLTLPLSASCTAALAAFASTADPPPASLACAASLLLRASSTPFSDCSGSGHHRPQRGSGGECERERARESERVGRWRARELRKRERHVSGDVRRGAVNRSLAILSFALPPLPLCRICLPPVTHRRGSSPRARARATAPRRTRPRCRSRSCRRGAAPWRTARRVPRRPRRSGGSRR